MRSLESPCKDPVLILSPRSDDWEITRFTPTPKVSTYLVAWANGDFEYVAISRFPGRVDCLPCDACRYMESSFTSPLTGKTIPLRVYATWDHIKQGQLALDTTAKILPIYEEIFDIAYPLPKLDTLVASDFDAVSAQGDSLKASIH